MNIDSIGSVLSKSLINETQPNKGTDFKNVLSDFIGSVNNDQMESNKVTQDFVLGGNAEIQDVMIAAEKAKTSLELLSEIKNKAIDCYKELTNMQV